MLTWGIASRRGSAEWNADAARVNVGPDGTTGIAVVDGIGHSEALTGLVETLAEVAARVSARRGTLAGILSAAQLVEGDSRDAVAVVAEIPSESDPGPVRVAWVGDCRAWWWCAATGQLRQMTTDQTMGQQLRASGGVPVDLASTHDHWVRVTLGAAVVATVRQVWVPDHDSVCTPGDMVLLTTDGVHDPLGADRMAAWVARHGDPQDLADALVSGARLAAGVDDCDDATAVVVQFGEVAGEASC